MPMADRGPIVVTGAGGQLGTELCRRLGAEAIGVTHGDLDISSREAVHHRLRELNPQVVINAAAYTKVDQAEREPELCLAINAEAVAHLAEACDAIGARLVQISTDYVFGDRYPQPRPHREDAPVLAQGVYAQSKLKAEEYLIQHPTALVVRTCGLYAHRAKWLAGPNFVDTMLRLGRERTHLRVVSDQTCSPSYVPHVADGILKLIDHQAQGVFHVVNTGGVTWAQFAREIFKLRGMPVEVEEITTEQYGAPAPRPSYSVLDTGKYAAMVGGPLPTVLEAVGEYLGSGDATIAPAPSSARGRNPAE
jgi:dTDP-4-dehydrorhamnose reductase